MFCYNVPMKNNSLSSTNPYLKNKVLSQKMRLRSIASSTAIETHEPISVIEQKLTQKSSSPYQVTLA